MVVSNYQIMIPDSCSGAPGFRCIQPIHGKRHSATIENGSIDDYQRFILDDKDCSAVFFSHGDAPQDNKAEPGRRMEKEF
jgi:hypothetical protein